LTRRRENAFDYSPLDVFVGSRGRQIQLYPRLLCSAGDPMPFLVVFLAHDESRVRAVVFSSSTRVWKIHPMGEGPSAPVRSDDDNRWVQTAVGVMQANGFMYWVYEGQMHLVSLDPATMRFSVVELPVPEEHQL
jgi:hypothetical protein